MGGRQLATNTLYGFIFPQDFAFADTVVGIPAEVLVVNLRKKDFHSSMRPLDFWLTMYKMGHRGPESRAATMYRILLDSCEMFEHVVVVMSTDTTDTTTSCSDQKKMSIGVEEILNTKAELTDKANQFVKRVKTVNRYINDQRKKIFFQHKSEKRHNNATIVQFKDLVDLVNTCCVKGTPGGKALDELIEQPSDAWDAVKKAFRHPSEKHTVFVLETESAVLDVMLKSLFPTPLNWKTNSGLGILQYGDTWCNDDASKVCCTDCQTSRTLCTF